MTNNDIQKYLDEIKKHLTDNNETQAFNTACKFYGQARKEGIKIGMQNSMGFIKNRLDNF